MKSHLSEEQLSEWVAGQQGGEVERHLRACPECAAEVERTRKALLLFRDSGYQCAEHWRKQPSAKRVRRVGAMGSGRNCDCRGGAYYFRDSASFTCA